MLPPPPPSDSPDALFAERIRHVAPSHRRFRCGVTIWYHKRVTVRDARRLWISTTRSKGFPNVAGRTRDPVRSFVRSFVLQSARSSVSNRYPPLNGVTRYRRPPSAYAFCSRFPFPLARHPSFAEGGKTKQKKKKEKKIVRISANRSSDAGVRSVERYG